MRRDRAQKKTSDVGALEGSRNNMLQQSDGMAGRSAVACIECAARKVASVLWRMHYLALVLLSVSVHFISDVFSRVLGSMSTLV